MSLPLPAADDSFAGQCQVKEGLAELKGQGVFQCLAIDDQCQLILFPQRVAQRWTMSRQRGTSSLKEDRVFIKKTTIKNDDYVPLK